jgi:hypothetical protein
MLAAYVWGGVGWGGSHFVNYFNISKLTFLYRRLTAVKPSNPDVEKGKSPENSSKDYPTPGSLHGTVPFCSVADPDPVLS